MMVSRRGDKGLRTNIDSHLLWGPWSRKAPSRERIHDPAFQACFSLAVVSSIWFGDMVVCTILVRLQMESACLLIDRMLRPVSNGELEDPLVDIDKSCLLDSLAHQIRNMHAVAGLSSYWLHGFMEVCKMGVFWHGAVIALKRSGRLQMVSDVSRLREKILTSMCSIHPPGARLS